MRKDVLRRRATNWAMAVLALSLSGSVGFAAEKPLIGAVQLDSQYEWYRTVELGMQAEAKDKGADLIVANSAGKVDQEDQNVSNLMARGVKALIISTIDTKASVPALQRAAAAGVKIINYDSDVDSPVMTTFVGVDNRELGAQMGRYVVDYVNKNMGGKAKIALLTVIRYAHSKLRREGFVDEIKKSAGIEIVAEQEGVVPDQASQNLETMLQAHPDTQLVWAANEGGTIGAETARRSTGANVKIFGTDMSLQSAASLLDPSSGVVAISTQDPYAIGQKSVDLAVEAMDGKDVAGRYDIPLAFYISDKPDAVKAYLEKYKSLAKR
jgi:sugar transport system substrate-binding protein